MWIGEAGPVVGYDPARVSPGTAQAVMVGGTVLITLSQGLANHLGIKLTSKLTDFSGYLILATVVAQAVVTDHREGVHSGGLFTLCTFDDFAVATYVTPLRSTRAPAL